MVAMIPMTQSKSSSTSLWGRFSASGDGNIAVNFAIVLVPLLGFVGAAVDYSRVSSARSSMQVALDSAALMVSKDIGSSSLSATEITARANTYFAALYSSKDSAAVPAVTAVYTPSTGKGATVKLNAEATVPTNFMKMVGTPSMTVKTASSTNWGSVRLRVALVLDVTGSMKGDKIKDLKTATTTLLAQLKASANKPEDVYVSIVPFSKFVNVDPANYRATWIDWSLWLAEPPNGTSPRDNAYGNSVSWKNVGPGSDCPYSSNRHGFTCMDRPATDPNARSIKKIESTGYICPSMDETYGVAREGRFYNGCYNTTGSNGNYKHVWRPADSASSPTAADLAVTPSKSTWNGCVTERGLSTGPSNDYDRKVTAPVAGTQASLWTADQNEVCSTPMMALSDNWDKMDKVVNGDATTPGLTPTGGTNQPIGLVWGWQSLVGGGPFPTPPIKDPAYEYQDIVVLMSDGLNTQNRWDGDGRAVEPEVDKRMYESSSVGTCPNMWNTVMIFTVQVNTDDSSESALLKNCASTNKKSGAKEYQLVTSAGGIGAAFNNIATKLTTLRVAK
jgi:Flp pilus assembly protein TadG